MLAGVPGSGATIYGSTINDWNNWQNGTLATSPIQFTLASDIRNRIRWIVPEQQLIVGTNYGEWSVGTRDSNEALSGANVNARRQVEFGSDPIQPINYADMSLYVEAGGKRVRAAQYNYEKDGYISSDMTILSEHLTSEISESYPNGYKIVRMAYSRTPDSIIWAIRDDGLLLAFTYEREHQVSAWSRHPFTDGGKVLDINSILHTDGDIVTLLVEREDGTYLETIRQENLCLDWQRNYDGILESDVIALSGDESGLIYLNQNLEEREPPHYGTGSFIYVSATISNTIVFKYNAIQLIEGEDYAKVSDKLYWIAQADYKAAIGVFDFTTQLTLNTDYQIYQKEDVFYLDIRNPAFDVSSLIVKISGVEVDPEDMYIMTGDDQVLLLDTAGNVETDITIEGYTVPDTCNLSLNVNDSVTADNLNEPFFTYNDETQAHDVGTSYILYDTHTFTNQIEEGVKTEDSDIKPIRVRNDGFDSETHEGFIYLDQSGTYQFGTHYADDTTTISVDGTLVMTHHGFNAKYDSIDLEPGYHYIKSTWVNTANGGTMSVNIIYPDGETKRLQWSDLYINVLTQSEELVEWVEGGSPVQVAPLLNLFSAQAETFTELRVTISSYEANDILAYTLPAGVSHSFSVDTHTFTGSMTAEEAEALIKSLTYESTNPTPPISKTLTMALDSTGNPTINYTSKVCIESANTPPILTALDVDDYVVHRPRKMISVYGSPQSEIWVGLKMTSIYEPVDRFNVPDNGGPGTRNRITEVEVYGVESLGGEVSANGGEKYEKLKYLTKEGKLSSPQEYVTGKFKAETPHGSQNDKGFIFRNCTPYKQKIAAIVFNGRRQASK